ncbi:MAG: ABC transporter permease [Ignisphaera sp.]
MFWSLIANGVAKAFATLLIATALIYLIARLFPGDPITVLYGEQQPSEEVRKAIESRLGLDKPLYMQVLIYWKRIFTGDWGRSIFFAEPVTQVVFKSLLNSLKLSILATVLTMLVCIALAYLSMARDIALLPTAISTLSSSMPTSVWGVTIMAVLALTKKPVGFGGIGLPLGGGGGGGAGVFYKILQSLLEKAYSEPFIGAYIALGMTRNRIFLKALRYVLPIYLTTVFYRAGLIIAGAMATEAIFAYPGMGLLLLQAFSSRDYPVLIGWAATVSIILATLNMVSDILHIYMDPRLRGSS